jgi:peptide chain release factor subunit 3
VGVQKLIVVINKMDDPSVDWSKDRYDQIVADLGEFLTKVCKFAPKDVIYVPISGFMGTNISEPMGDEHWYKGPTLLQAFDEIELPQRQSGLGLRMPVVSCFRDEGINVYGKVECGTVTKG